MDKLKYKLVEEAPCFWCGYNGAGFFQTHTHKAHCPWYNIGGAENRKNRVLDVICMHWAHVRLYRIAPLDVEEYYKEA